MKVGIMSMQRIKNYGSFLQAYSLKRNLEEIGHTVEFVDYKVENVIQGNNDSDNRVKRDYLGFLRRKLGIYTKAEKLFLQKKAFKCRYDSEFFPLLGISEEKNYTPELDVLVIGSDEVFNCLQKNKDVGYSKQLFGKDNRANRLISYAASAGNTTVEGMKNAGIADEVAQLLSDFDSISVRDENTYRIINDLTGMTPLIHLDPVLLYDYPESYEYTVPIKNYLIVYAYTNRISPEEAAEIKKYAAEAGKTIVCLGEYQEFCDMYIPATPFELLAYFRNADCVITDTFHGTVFSILQNTPFATIVRESTNGAYGNAEKLRFLLNKFNLAAREVKDINAIKQILNEKIDFESVNDIIKQERKKSMDYLRGNVI